MAYDVGFRFVPSELALVRTYLRNNVASNESKFIKTMNVYEKDPWRFEHDPNSLYHENKWYYFVKRTKRGRKTVNRSVPRTDESEGGTWKATGKKIEIVHKGRVYGYKQELVYNMKVDGKIVKSDWLMTEYSLCMGGNDDFQDLVLCCIRNKEKKDETQQQQHLVPHEIVENNNNNVGSNQEQEGEDGFANELENMLEEKEENQNATSLVLPLPTTQSHSNNNNVMVLNQEEIQQQEDTCLVHLLPPLTTQSNNIYNTSVRMIPDEDFNEFLHNLPVWSSEFDDFMLDQDQPMEVVDENGVLAQQQHQPQA